MAVQYESAEMVVFPTPYTDPFVSMNPAICRPRHAGGQAGLVVGSAITRKPPNILRERAVLQAKLMATFGFRSAIFEPHVANFAEQVISVHQGRRQPSRMAIDVRYRWCNEYYHFLTEVLPNALVIQRHHAADAVVCAAAAFTRELFRWFGIEQPIIQMSWGWQRVRCRYVECGNPSPEKIAAIRDVTSKKLRFEKTAGVLIRRHRSRRIRNEAAVLAQLRLRYRSLEWTVFDALSVAETATLFSKAAVIAGPHGAGFANMLFSGSGTAIVEFMPLEQPNLCYWHLAEVLGNPYVMIPYASDRSRSMVVELGPDILASLPGP